MEHPVKEIRNVIRSLTQGTPDEQQDAVYRYFLPGASFMHPFCRVPSFVGLKLPGAGELDSRALIVAILKWYKILSPKIELDIESCVFDQRTNLLYVKISQVFSIWLIPFHRAPVSLVTVLHLAPAPAPAPHSSSSATVNGTSSANANPPSTPEQPYDAAQEKLQSIQEGSEPSYAAVVASGPEASASTDQDKDSKQGGGKGGSRGAVAAKGSTDAGSSKPVRYYIKKQEDLYQVNEFLKFVLLAPGASVCGAFQLLATMVCVFGVILLSPLMRAVGIAGRGIQRVA
ncbi:Putative flavin-binding monooxygenase-like protein [Madurella fahalii]|uniref:Flavin-binding monooxygenase-like protein n=1 Tax=Madurella fahalii TaxID=1157608 RepID=A0ABQ0GN54_9PEZI